MSLFVDGPAADGVIDGAISKNFKPYVTYIIDVYWKNLPLSPCLRELCYYRTMNSRNTCALRPIEDINAKNEQNFIRKQGHVTTLPQMAVAELNHHSSCLTIIID
jgi:hypothetical protein